MRIGICSIQRNRGPWIREWVLFHYLLGVRYFYIGIHKTQDDSVGVLKTLASHINIKIFTVSDTTALAPQQDFFQYTLDRYRYEVDWMAFIDQDEFLFSTKAKTLQAALQNFSHKKYSALGVYWKCFGSSGHIKEPEGLILDNYKYRAPDDSKANRHVKSVVYTAMADSTIRVSCVHRFETPHGTYDELGRFIAGGFSDLEPSYEHLRINHYVCQSREYFLKVKRPQGDGNRNVTKAADLRSEAWWEGHDRNDVRCDVIDRFIPGLKDLDLAFLKGEVGEARARDVKIPTTRRLKFMVELVKNFPMRPRLTLSRLLSLHVRRCPR